MAGQWQKAKPGIRYRAHPTRKHGVIPDRYYTLYYKVDGKMVQEALGWASDGWTLKKAGKILAELKENQRQRVGPRTLKERREEQRREKAQSLTVAEFWEKDYLHNVKGRIKADSAAREEREFKLRIKPQIGEKELKDLTSSDVEKIIDKMKAKGLSPRSQEYLKGTIFRLWKHAARRKLVKAGDNPAMGIKLQRTPKLKNPVLIAGWPGIGNIGIIAVDTLRGTLGAEEFGEIEPWDFFYPKKVLIRSGVLEGLEFPVNKFYLREPRERT